MYRYYPHWQYSHCSTAAPACRAVSSDTGNYSCEPSNAESDTVQVHVLEGTGTKQNVNEYKAKRDENWKYWGLDIRDGKWQILQQTRGVACSKFPSFIQLWYFDCYNWRPCQAARHRILIFILFLGGLPRANVMANSSTSVVGSILLEVGFLMLLAFNHCR